MFNKSLYIMSPPLSINNLHVIGDTSKNKITHFYCQNLKVNKNNNNTK